VVCKFSKQHLGLCLVVLGGLQEYQNIMANFFWGEKQAGKQLYHSFPNIDILAATGSV